MQSVSISTLRPPRPIATTRATVRFARTVSAALCIWCTGAVAGDYITMNRSEQEGPPPATAEEGIAVVAHVVVPEWVAFLSLVRQWHEERGVLSSASEMAMCPAYQRIIAIGPPAIGMILRQMIAERDEPDLWFWALRVLTNEDPVAEGARGNINAMARAWIAWGHANQYV